MPKPSKGPRIGGSPSHERIILANMASQLFEHGRITTTETRARRLQPLAERLISKAKRGDLHARRLVKQTIGSADVLHTLFAEIAPKMEGREGGYTRITKVGPRKGDNAPMAVIELVTEPVKKAAPKKAAPKKADEAKAAIAEAEEFKTVDQAADDAEAVDAPADEQGEAAVADEEAVEVAEEPAAEAADEADEDQGLIAAFAPLTGGVLQGAAVLRRAKPPLIGSKAEPTPGRRLDVPVADRPTRLRRADLGWDEGRHRTLGPGLPGCQGRAHLVIPGARDQVGETEGGVQVEGRGRRKVSSTCG